MNRSFFPSEFDENIRSPRVRQKRLVGHFVHQVKAIPFTFVTLLFKHLLDSGILIAPCFLVLMAALAPHIEPSDFDYDEGINLMKSLLVTRGHLLYAEIWSDQPPLFTLLLSVWMSFFGETVAVARWLIILFSTMLLWAFYRTLVPVTSTFAALAGVFLLVISDYFLRLSGAVMIGLPAIALAMTSIVLILNRHSRYRLILSAVIMGLAVQTKLMAALAIPGLLVYLYIKPTCRAAMPLVPPLKLQSAHQRLHVLAWLSLFLVTVVGIGHLTQSLAFDQLLMPHFGTQTRHHEPFMAASATFLPRYIRQHLVLILVGSIGLGWSLFQKRREVVVPSIWLFCTLVALSIHHPLWYHHVLNLSVPLIWLVGYGIEAWFRAILTALEQNSLRGVAQRLAPLLLVAMLVVFSLWRYPTVLPQRLSEQMVLGRPLMSQAVVEQLVVDSSDANKSSEWLFTDRPYYAFVAGRSVPPELAVFSRKRLNTGQLTTKQLVNTILAYQPEAILLERFADQLGPELESIIEQEYTLVLEKLPARYYRRTVSNE